MDPEIVNNANAITPDASAAMLKGAISNTFEAAMLGKELLSSPELVQRRISILNNSDHFLYFLTFFLLQHCFKF